MVGFLDSPYYIDIPPYTPTYRGFQYEEQQKYKYMNTKNIISEECAARYPSSPPPPPLGSQAVDTDTPIHGDTTISSASMNSNATFTSDTTITTTSDGATTTTIPFVNEQWKCQFGQYRLPFVQTSYFMVTSQYDSYQLQMDLGQAAPPPFKSPGETLYAEQFATTLQQHLNELKEYKTKERSQLIPVATNTATSTGTSKSASATASANAITTAAASIPTLNPVTAMTYGLYSWSCYNHDVSSSSAFYTMTVDEGE